MEASGGKTVGGEDGGSTTRTSSKESSSSSASHGSAGSSGLSRLEAGYELGVGEVEDGDGGDALSSIV
jgi:hypothetical protein